MASHTVDWREAGPAEVRGGAVAIGNFDGVHRGHAALVAALRRQADAAGGPAVALTFDPHPAAVLRPGVQPPVLTSPADRADLLQRLGADHVVTIRPTPDLLGLSADEFFRRVVLDSLEARAMAEGENFGFGRDREGNVATLARLCRDAGVSLAVVPPLRTGDEPVSSSRVRHALLRGDVCEAALLLGRPYRLQGLVGTGQRRGRTIGFPTANLTDVETLVPGDGVYAVRVLLEKGTRPGAANVGPNPTFGEGTRKIEVHVLDYQGDLYGCPLAVEFVDRLRDTRPFGGAADLVAQLRRDVELARARLAGG